MAKDYNIGGEVNEFGQRTARIGELEKKTGVAIATKEKERAEQSSNDQKYGLFLPTLITAAAVGYIIYEMYCTSTGK